MAGSVDEEALHQLYLWVDNIPLSRPKRNLSRDFSDGGVCSNVCECVRTHAWVCPACLCVNAFCPVCTCVQGLCEYMSLGVCVLVAEGLDVG